MKRGKQRKQLKITLIVAMILLIISGCSTTNTNLYNEVVLAKKIVWGIDVESGVFGHYDIIEQQPVGFDIDIAKAITAEILGDEGKAEFVEVMGKTRVPMLKTNAVDVIAATLTVTEERQKLVGFSDTYFVAGQGLLVTKDSKLQRLEEMTKDDVLIMVKGTTSAAAVNEINKEVKTIEFESYAEAFVALDAGQGDAMTSDNSILFTFATENPNYMVLPELFTTENYGLAVEKKQTDLLEAINEALETIKENGTYQKIYDKWIPKAGGN